MVAACISVVLAGCETTPPDTADYWPEQPVVQTAQAQPAAKKPGRTTQAAVEVRVLGAPRSHSVEMTLADIPDVMPRPAPREPIDDRGVSDTSRTASIITSVGEFEWPVEGKVISAFGKGGDGMRNDGINIAAELGTPIHAAAAGTVTYVGELKGYGKLILIRHGNGFITAYAHAQRIIVDRGDRVDRGDVIGFAGSTGDVATPQLHFEVRAGVRPVDPRPLLLDSRDS